MQKVVLYGPGNIALEEGVEPAPGRGEVLVRVSACGICGSDLHSYKGEHPLVIYPVTPGHEFSGTIVAAGEEVDTRMEGSRVCVEPSLYCGHCPQCMGGRYNICSNLKVMGFQAPGAMCDLVAVPANRIHKLPDGVSLLDGAIAEPAAVGVHAVARSGVLSGDEVLVVGAGVIGLMVLKAALAVGCAVDVVEGSEERAARSVDFGARKAAVFGGASGGVSRSEESPEYSVVFECVGKPETIDFAVRAAPRGSTIVVVGVPPGPVQVPVPLVQDGELDVRGTLMYMGQDFEKALELIAEGEITSSDFVTDAFPLRDVTGGYRLMSEAFATTLKVMIEIE